MAVEGRTQIISGKFSSVVKVGASKKKIIAILFGRVASIAHRWSKWFCLPEQICLSMLLQFVIFAEIKRRALFKRRRSELHSAFLTAFWYY